MEPNNKASVTFQVGPYVHNCSERAIELLQIARELLAYVKQGKIEHFPADDAFYKDRKKIVTTLDKGSAQRIIAEAQRMEMEALEMIKAYGLPDYETK